MRTATLPVRRSFRFPRRVFSLPLAAVLSLSLLPLTAHGASNVRIHVDGRTVTLSSTGATVREALAAAGVTLGRDDEVTPPLEAAVPGYGGIRVSRVTYTESSAEAKIAYRTVVRPAVRGNRPYHPTVIREGRSGLKRVTYRTKVVDGRPQGRSVVGQEVVREPVHEIVFARKPLLLGSRGAYTGKRTMSMLATAYDPGPGSCGKYADGRTCNGKRAGYGIIAVDPKVIPLGTKLFVPGYGFGIAADVGGAIKGNRIDLGFNSRSGSFKWGKKWVRMTVVD